MNKRVTVREIRGLARTLSEAEWARTHQYLNDLASAMSKLSLRQREATAEAVKAAFQVGVAAGSAHALGYMLEKTGMGREFQDYAVPIFQWVVNRVLDAVYPETAGYLN